MTALTASDISCMQEAAEAIMLDAGTIGVRSAPVDGEPTGGTWTYGNSTPLGVNDREAREILDGSHATLSDAVIRVPLSVTRLAPEGRIKVTHVKLTALDTPVIYAIKG